jgi:hypothetical protein
VAGDDQRVPAGHLGAGLGIGEVLAGGLHTHHRDPVLAADLGLAEGEPLGFLRRVHLHDGEPVVEFDEVQHPPGHQVGGPDAGGGLRVDHVVGTDAGQDLAVRGRDGLDPEMLDPQIQEVHGDQHAGFNGRTDTDDGGVELLCPELAERVDVGGIRLHHVGERAGEFLDQGRVPFDRQDLAALLDQLLGRRRAEAAEPDDKDRRVVRRPAWRGSVSQ